jgi:hypothetical protein
MLAVVAGLALTLGSGVLSVRASRRAMLRPITSWSDQSRGWFRDPSGHFWEWTCTRTRGVSWGQMLDLEHNQAPGTAVSPGERERALAGAGVTEGTPQGWRYLASRPDRANFAVLNWVVVGWPLRSFEAAQGEYSRGAQVAGGKVLRGTSLDGADVPEWIRPRPGVTGWSSVLPTGVRWGAFSGNVAIFGAGALALLHIVPLARRARSACWRARGRCGACGYQLEPATPICPECGLEAERPEAA